jgi:flagellar hook-basal body complex protein FliE
MSEMTISSKLADELFSKIRNTQSEAKTSISTPAGGDGKTSGTSFFDHLKQSISEVNNAQKTSDAMTTDLATGKSGNLHETMLSITNAELAFNLMVQVRNRALEAYQEVMRMPV